VFLVSKQSIRPNTISIRADALSIRGDDGSIPLDKLAKKGEKGSGKMNNVINYQYINLS
jgi:hypothetical protein